MNKLLISAAAWTLSVVALVFAACIPPKTADGIAVGLQAAACVLETYSDDLRAGKDEEAAIADAVIKCGVDAVQASNILSSHRRAMVLEGSVRPKPACTGQSDGGADH